MVGDKDDTIELRNVAEESSEVIDNSALFLKNKARTGYRGTPLNDQVLVQRFEREVISTLVIPDSAKEKSDMGLVISSGPGLVSQYSGARSVLSVKAGDLVLYDKFAAVGQEITLVNEEGYEQEFLILREQDIMLTLEEFEIK